MQLYAQKCTVYSPLSRLQMQRIDMNRIGFGVNRIGFGANRIGFGVNRIEFGVNKIACDLYEYLDIHIITVNYMCIWTICRQVNYFL